MEILSIDGSMGEGGGQILRTALSLSMLTKKSFQMVNIRSNRKEPGLKAQHLHAIKALMQVSECKCQNMFEGSPSITFFPSEINKFNLTVDIGTAGSITLLLQAVLPALMFAREKTRITIKGGTDVSWSIPFDYFNSVLAPQIRRHCGIELRLVKRGYYPKGGGIVEAEISPRISLSEFPDFNSFLERVRRLERFELVERGNLVCIKGVSHASSALESARVCERQAEIAVLQLKKLGQPIQIKKEYSNSESIGSGLSLFAFFSEHRSSNDFNSEHPIILGADSLGKQGKPAEDVAVECVNSLLSEIDANGCVDSHLSDQLIPFLGLFGGMMRISKITEHLKTNILVTEAFLGKCFRIDEENRIISTIF
ncbi:MAG: RNA 3'-terminal phosphate cyclase [Candidatus Woesearchaeota archaeon]|nr:RNA 3'-terminal phosphate cyclase [Candidatus Woesearchaeota archaeon]